jgi:inorganic triphosphatase YgiF
MPEEREVKLEVPESFVLPRLDGVVEQVHPIDRGVRLLEATYWDTPNMDLYRSGRGLRHRTSDGTGGTWTIKADARRDGFAVVRSEVDVVAPPESPPQGILETLPASVDGALLRPVARISNQRHLVDLFDEQDARWAELADDHVAVLRGHQVVETFREVELEITGADRPEWTRAFVDTLLGAGARDAGGKGKHSRALEALGLLPASDR